MIELIEEQQKAVDAQDGIWIVLAGPGSGKTTVLVKRYLKMLTSGIPYDQMLNLTFTHGAALSMASRAGILDAKNVFRTFHSFALEMLKNERHRLPFATCDTILPFELQDFKLLFKLADIYRKDWREIQNHIVGWKCGCVNPDKAMEECMDEGEEMPYALAYADYEVKCREEGWLDFASLMEEAVKMLEENDEVRNKYKKKYIAVDEAQDCDEIQFRMLQLLFGGNIFAVGDENQLIYEWRNARSGNLTDFARVFPGAQVLYLGTNHRSTGNIVRFLKEIIPVDNGLASHMTTYNDAGPEIKFTYYPGGEEEEAEQVLKLVKDPINTAIIARTNRQLFIYQRLLSMRGVKYNFLGKKDFWEQGEIKKLLEYARQSRSKKPAHIALAEIIAEKNMIATYSKIGAKNPMEQSPVENLTGIVKIAANKGTLPEFLEYARKITYARKSPKALTLSTVHQAKGLEWDYVFVVGARQGTMPHKNGEIKEEHRIMFVACSRPAKELHISFYDNLSQFLLKYEDQVQEHEYDDEKGLHDEAAEVDSGS